MKVFLEITFIGDQLPELAGFPSLFDRIKCCVVNENSGRASVDRLVH